MSLTTESLADDPARAGAVHETARVPLTTLRSQPRVAPNGAPATATGTAWPSARTRWQHRYVVKLRIIDVSIVAGAVLLGEYIRFGQVVAHPAMWNYLLPAVSTAIAGTWLLALTAFRTRSPRVIGTGVEEYRRVVAASVWTFGAIAIVGLLFKLEISRGYLAVALPLGIVGLLVNRIFWRSWLRKKRLCGSHQTAVLAVGDREAVTHMMEELSCDPTDGYRIVGACIPGYGPAVGEALCIGGYSVPVLGGESAVLEAISAVGADTVAVAGTEHFGVSGIRRLIWKLEPMGVDLVVSTGVMDVALSRLVMRPSAGLPLLHIEKPQYQGAKRFQKRLFDLCFSVTALTVAFPMLVVAMLAIKLTSRGPILYRAERIGIDSGPFPMLKLRTMIQDADKQVNNLLGQNDSDGVLFKMREDPRITSVGRVLRRFSIDELPQFINVLRGEMSVVGPRPPLRREVEAYDSDVLRRLLVKPGVTGLWQVSGRSDLSWDESVRLDLSYVDNWSMVGDIVIVIKTLRAVLQRKGAY